MGSVAIYHPLQKSCNNGTWLQASPYPTQRADPEADGLGHLYVMAEVDAISGRSLESDESGWEY
jgi:hypothetical protein